MLPAILALALLLGVTLCVLGLRGRRIDDHPTCRRCRFDLHNLPDTTERCPECGGPISDPKAIRFGRRRRRGGMIVTGGVLGLLSGALLAVVIASIMAGAKWNAYKPLALLTYEAGSAHQPTADAAHAEMLKRFRDDESLSALQIARLVERALVLQAAPGGKWHTGWGDIVEHAWISGLLDDERKKRYARHAVRFTLIARPTVRYGDEPPLTIRPTGARA